jgi:REP element-mobilizing transposase RayT
MYTGDLSENHFIQTMKEFYRRHLPHWHPRDAIFFVTFRLKGSLPYEVIENLREESEREKRLLALLPESEQGHGSTFEEQRYFEKWNAALDQEKKGPHWLAQPEFADVVKEAMYYRDGKVFDLHAYCIMSNHVHAIFKPICRSECHSDFPRIMQSLKSHTARHANLILGREGAFWQDESYDHVIRDGEEYARMIHYVLENPVKCGLVERWNAWPWTYCKPEILP